MTLLNEFYEICPYIYIYITFESTESTHKPDNDDSNK